MQQKTKCRQTTDRDKRVHTAFASSGFSVAAPQYGTHSRLALAPVLHHTHSVIFLKPTVSNRSLVPPSGLHECLRFGLWPTLCAWSQDFQIWADLDLILNAECFAQTWIWMNLNRSDWSDVWFCIIVIVTIILRFVKCRTQSYRGAKGGVNQVA